MTLRNPVDNTTFATLVSAYDPTIPITDDAKERFYIPTAPLFIPYHLWKNLLLFEMSMLALGEIIRTGPRVGQI